MQQKEPNDSVVRTAILSALADLDGNIKPNKLRKLICKNVENTNWTQYQRVLDGMIGKEGVLKTTTVDNEVSICPIGDSSSTGMLNDDEQLEEKNKRKKYVKSASSSKKAKMRVPLAIIYHLVKKGQKKQKSLELNSKTKFIFKEEALVAVKKKDFDINEETDFIIESRSEHHDGEEELGNRHIKTAKLHVSKMVKAFNVNPERFCRRKAGGTFKEQEEAKKRKQEAVQKKRNKKLTSNTYESIDTKQTETSLSKKKRRKFY